jgi:uncharacterized protein YndB with AHSA1/START domain
MSSISTKDRPAQDGVGQEFIITRVFDAPRDLVWAAMTEPKHLLHWWGPKGFTVERCDMDLRVGGLFHYALKAPDGKIIWGKWIFRDIKKTERLTVVVAFSNEKGGETRHPMAPTWPLTTLSTTTVSGTVSSGVHDVAVAAGAAVLMILAGAAALAVPSVRAMRRHDLERPPEEPDLLAPHSPLGHDVEVVRIPM